MRIQNNRLSVFQHKSTLEMSFFSQIVKKHGGCVYETCAKLTVFVNKNQVAYTRDVGIRATLRKVQFDI
jgi:hypothetical protein